MRTIVVSGVNLFRGGTLKIMQDCIESLSFVAGEDYQIVALVHNSKQFKEYKNVRYISYPKSRKSWIFRLYYEYIGFKKISKQLKPYLWFSLHDTTPNVIAEKRAVYCHNTFPFFRPRWQDLFIQPEIVAFSLFSRFFIQPNIKKNTYVVVQQEWLREAFEKMFSIDNIVVALPIQTKEPIELNPVQSEVLKEKIRFFYPATPMIHKNYEVICKAASLLEREGMANFEILLTFTGEENRYTKKIKNSYSHLNSLRFIGFLTGDEMNNMYQNCDCLLFSSKVESWGLPISEAKELDKPVLVADLPYAYEASGKYDKVKFFNPDDAKQLAGYMKNFIQGNIVYDEAKELAHKEPITRDWDELVRFLLT